MQRLNYMTQLFPNIFTEILCVQMYTYGQSLVAEIAKVAQGRQEKLKILVSVINLFHQLPAASDRFLEKLISLVFLAEKVTMIEAGSNLREPLRKFLMRYPEKTIDVLLKECNIKEDQIYRFLEYLISGTDGQVFRQILMRNPAKLIRMASGPISQQEQQQVNNANQQNQQQATQTQQQQQQPQQQAAANQTQQSDSINQNNSQNVQQSTSSDQQATTANPQQTQQQQSTPSIVNVVYELDFQGKFYKFLKIQLI